MQFAGESVNCNDQREERRRNVRYELYIDVFFCINFMMDYILLALLRRMLPCTATRGSIAAGAAAGAALACAVICLPIPYAFLKLLLFHSLVNGVMLKIGLKVGWGRDFLKAFVFLYIGGFLLGGVMTVLRQYLRAGSLFFVLALLGYYVSSGVLTLLEALMRRKGTERTAVLIRGERQCRVRALLDTGNRLYEPLSGRPVSIIAQETGELLGLGKDEEGAGSIGRVAYHAVGTAAGELEVYALDEMRLYEENAGKAALVRFPLVAVCAEGLEHSAYGMILNPDIAMGGNEG